MTLLMGMAIDCHNEKVLSREREIEIESESGCSLTRPTIVVTLPHSDSVCVLFCSVLSCRPLCSFLLSSFLAADGRMCAQERATLTSGRQTGSQASSQAGRQTDRPVDSQTMNQKTHRPWRTADNIHTHARSRRYLSNPSIHPSTQVK